jgi:hypothetical protein
VVAEEAERSRRRSSKNSKSEKWGVVGDRNGDGDGGGDGDGNGDGDRDGGGDGGGDGDRAANGKDTPDATPAHMTNVDVEEQDIAKDEEKDGEEEEKEEERREEESRLAELGVRASALVSKWREAAANAGLSDDAADAPAAADRRRLLAAVSAATKSLVAAAVVGLYKSNAQCPRSLKAPGFFNPRALNEMRYPGLNICFQIQLVPLHGGLPRPDALVPFAAAGRRRVRGRRDSAGRELTVV